MGQPDREVFSWDGAASKGAAPSPVIVMTMPKCDSMFSLLTYRQQEHMEKATLRFFHIQCRQFLTSVLL